MLLAFKTHSAPTSERTHSSKLTHSRCCLLLMRLLVEKFLRKTPIFSASNHRMHEQRKPVAVTDLEQLLDLGRFVFQVFESTLSFKRTCK